MWQRFIDGVEQFRAELMGRKSIPRRRISDQQSGGDDDDDFSIALDMPAQTQEEANAAFVRGYTAFINGHVERPEGRLYCCMVPLGGCWWMARGHPLVGVLRNSGMRIVSSAQGGSLVAFTNQDVEEAMLEIGTWFDTINATH